MFIKRSALLAALFATATLGAGCESQQSQDTNQATPRENTGTQQPTQGTSETPGASGASGTTGGASGTSGTSGTGGSAGAGG